MHISPMVCRNRLSLQLQDYNSSNTRENKRVTERKEERINAVNDSTTVVKERRDCHEGIMYM